ncbi:MAG TPA: Ig-like domain repeat protein, partial [Solirubrobacteraceae bacterium]|nr:Ig-like domain repeat protein [Solirubrobacteraceae bacterium]
VQSSTTLTGAATLDVSGSLSWTGGAMTGSGQTVLETGASGSFEMSSGCEAVHLEDRRLVNEATLTLSSGTVFLANGAELLNLGTFADNSEASCHGPQLQAVSGGSAPSILNRDEFEKTAGGGTSTVDVNFGNDGHVQARTGRLVFADGGIPEKVAAGVWSVAGGGSIALTAGTFLIGEEVDLSAVEVAGATVEREPASGPPFGELNADRFAAGTVTISGSGTSAGSGFSNASIELAPAGSSEWVALCGPLTPSLIGEFECAWNTAGGSDPDGSYQLRARLDDEETPPDSRFTTPIDVLVDNTAPGGSVTPPSYLGGVSTIAGTATDAGSGVYSWQLQIAKAGSSEWANACAVQTAPVSGDEFQCAANVSADADGAYALRALITDNAGNDFTTPTGETTIDNTPPAGSLATVAEGAYIKATLTLEGTASDAGSGVASWTPQIAPAGGAWSNACAPQTTPTGGTYACSVNTSGYSDGNYEFRARVLDRAGNAYTTAPQSKTIDNTPPSGSLDLLERSVKGTIDVKGPARDATSAVASWQLEIRSTAAGTWVDACSAQTSPAEGLDVYGCSVDTTALADGSYQLRAQITDIVGNSYTTRPITTRVETGESEPTETSCTVSWTGAAGDGSWQSAGNWSTDSVPGEGDRACLPSGATVSVSSGSARIGSIAGDGQLTIDGGSLELADGSTVSEIDRLLFSSGSLVGPGTLDVADGGSILEGAACGDGGDDVTLSGVDLVNEGTLTLGAAGGAPNGAIAMSDGAQVLNSGTLNDDTDSSTAGACSHREGESFAAAEGTASSITNTGTFNVEVGSGNATKIDVPFENEGTAHVQSGALVIGSADGGTWTTSGAAVITSNSALSIVDVHASGAHFAIGEGGTISVPSETTSTIGTLTMSGGTLTLAGELDVSGSFAGDGDDISFAPTIEGSGKLVIKPAATATMNNAACGDGGDDVALSGVDLVNEGTLTLGVAGGSPNGALAMSDGAHVLNSGTLNDDTDSSTAGACHYGEGESFAAAGGATPSVTNTGTFNVEVGSGHGTKIDVPFDNQGALQLQSGTLRLDGGGAAEVPAHGTWTSEGEPILLTGGTFYVAEETDFSDVLVEGANVIWVGPKLRGSLQTLPSYVSGDVTVAGGGEGGLDGMLSDASVEVLAPGAGSWSTLCGPLSTGIAGTFECSWETAGGAYAEGEYQLRALLETDASPPKTLTTATMSVTVDNTPPTGALSAPSEHAVGGPVDVTGSASDGGSGVESWTLQIAPEGSSEWTLACPAQVVPLSESDYGCTINTGEARLADGTYQLRELVRDRAGNEHVSSPVDVRIDDSHLSGTLEALPEAVTGTVTLEGEATSTGAEVSSWSLQITPADASSWTSACAPQTTPVSGSTYGCELDTEALADGPYDLRALVTDADGDTYTTEPIATVFDHTPPQGYLYQLPSSVSGSIDVDGYAADAASGVASWTLEVAAPGSESFSEACAPQTEPIFGFVYGCSFEAGGRENGEYRLRAQITDIVGNTYTTPAITTTIDNTAPTSAAAPSISGHLLAGQTLKSNPGTWAGPGPITYAYQWQRCDSAGESCAEIEGATSSSYALSGEDVGATVRVAVTATNGAGATEADSPVSAAVAADTLSNLAVARITGSPEAGGELVAGPGEWSGAAPISFSYSWQRCNSSGAECSAIEGASEQRYTLTSADVSSTLRVAVTATNAEGSATATSAASSAVAPSSGSGIRYLYDRAGRLSIVDDPETGAALYHWDADGNLTSIERV